MIFLDVQAFRDTGEVPNWVYGSLMDVQLSCLIHEDLAIHVQTAILDLILELWDNHVCASNRNCGTNVQALFDFGFVVFTGEMAEGIHGDNLGDIGPLRLLLDLNRWFRVLKVWLVLSTSGSHVIGSDVIIEFMAGGW